jgi:hypothetical protein
LQEEGRLKDSTISTREESIELLQTKLKETSVTLQSNVSTIDELKKSLAEAQKYSFRAIVNNRTAAHHPVVNQTTTLSNYLRVNDRRESRSRSNSPYRFDGGNCNHTFTSGSKLQESYISVKNRNVGVTHGMSSIIQQSTILEESAAQVS